MKRSNRKFIAVIVVLFLLLTAAAVIYIPDLVWFWRFKNCMNLLHKTAEGNEEKPLQELLSGAGDEQRALIFIMLSDIYEAEGRGNEARDLIQKAVSLLNKTRNKKLLIAATAQSARMEWAAHNLNLASDLYKKTIELLKEPDSNRGGIKVCNGFFIPISHWSVAL